MLIYWVVCLFVWGFVFGVALEFIDGVNEGITFLLLAFVFSLCWPFFLVLISLPPAAKKVGELLMWAKR